MQFAQRCCKSLILGKNNPYKSTGYISRFLQKDAEMCTDRLTIPVDVLLYICKLDKGQKKMELVLAALCVYIIGHGLVLSVMEVAKKNKEQ